MKTLTELIPKANLDVYLHIFHKIKSLNLRDFGVDDWLKPTFEIKDNLEILANQGYIRKTDVRKIWQNIFSCMAEAGSGGQVALSVLPHLLSLKHQGPIPRNEALDFLVFALWQDCETWTGKPHFSTIANFLTGKNIYSNANDEMLKDKAALTGEVLGKRVIHLNAEGISNLILFASVCCSHDDPLIPSELAAHYDRRGFLATLPHDPFTPPPVNNPFAIKKRTQKRK